jgi:hypothetical protein
LCRHTTIAVAAAAAAAAVVVVWIGAICSKLRHCVVASNVLLISHAAASPRLGC